MPKPRVYVETTIPSSYHDLRTDHSSVTRRDLTREWWRDAAVKHELLTGAPVVGELRRGSSRLVALRISLVSGLPLLTPDAASGDIVDVYVRNKLMPANSEDALHLALASRHRCDFIVTWDRKHLANPNKRTHLASINTRLGLHIPMIVTPADLLRRMG
jgi:predicted nucleic acid-binding protein